ncbi:hypothetical protein VKT23_020098 [Stygiomarasmius scandens]|uniref:Vacuolar calcium ion transporter n=1 Tax=Marasmiellus scandens TaxID=2682957 RepID=A0ABR1INW9_9AGAR
MQQDPYELESIDGSCEERYAPPRRANTEPAPRINSPFISRKRIITSTVDLVNNRLQKSATLEKTLTAADGQQSRLQGMRRIVSPFWVTFSCITIALTALSWALHFALGDKSPTGVFVSAFMALMLQAYILGYATEQLSLSSGEKVAALLNVSFGNAVELIVAIIALTKCELEVVQSSLIGSVFSNLLLVTGMALIAGGLRHGVQRFSSEEAQLQSALLVFACCSILFPTVSYILQSFNNGANLVSVDNQLYAFSRGSAVVSVLGKISPSLAPMHILKRSSIPVYVCFLTYSMGLSKKPSTATKADDLELNDTSPTETSEEEDEEPSIGRITALSILLGVTAVVGVTAEFLVSSLDGMTSEGPLSKQFVSVILLPIVGNAAEHCSAIMLAVKNKARMSLDIAVGSSLQISLFVLPVSVLLGWAMGHPMTLFFDPFQAVVLLVSVLLVSFIIQDGKSNWMEGVLLFAPFVNLCVGFQVYSGFESTTAVNTCS